MEVNKIEDLIFNTTNENKEYSKPKIPSGQYEFKIVDIKPSNDKLKNFFILEMVGQVIDKEQVSLVWSTPVSDEYSPNTNLGKLLLAVGFELGGEIKAKDLMNMVGKCIVNDYTKQIDGKVVTYSVVGELVVPEQKEEVTTD